MDIKTANLEEVQKELKECEALWSIYSCDCLGYYMNALENRIMELLS